MTRKRRRLWAVLAGLGMLGIAAALVLNAFSDSLVFFYSPSDLKTKSVPVGRHLRIGGLVEDHSLVREANGRTIEFRVTDGANAVTATSNLNNSEYSAYGYAASGWLGATDGSQMRQTLDAKTAALCTNIKGDKNLVTADHYIYVYTISYNVTDSAAQTLLQHCATRATDCLGGQCYFNSSSLSSLQDVFASVALELNQLRLAR